MQRIRDVIANTVRPSWVVSVPHDFGSASAGTLKASEWHALGTIFLPIALVSLWGEGNDTMEVGEGYQKVLENTMHLVQAAKVICYHSTSASRAARYRTHIAKYLEGLKEIHGTGFCRPNHHMALHLYDFLLSFGPIRAWWMFPYERLNGHLQELPHNHRHGMCYLFVEDLKPYICPHR